MEDTLILISEHLLCTHDSNSLLAFVKLQATHRSVWLRYRHDIELWKRLGKNLPQWSLPQHMGVRRKVIMGIKLLNSRCVSCHGKASRFFMAFQGRICGRCCRRVLVSDFELAWCVCALIVLKIFFDCQIPCVYNSNQVVWNLSGRPTSLHYQIHRQHASPLLFQESRQVGARKPNPLAGPGLQLHAQMAGDY